MNQNQTWLNYLMRPLVRFYASPDAIIFTLLVGVVFLVSNYQWIVYNVNPQHGELSQWDWLVYAKSYIDAVFFANATITVLFQSKSKKLKIVFCSFEGIMILLTSLSGVFIENKLILLVILAIYLALFSGVALWSLGLLAIEKGVFQYYAQSSFNSNYNSSQNTDTNSHSHDNHFVAVANKVGFNYSGEKTGRKRKVDREVFMQKVKEKKSNTELAKFFDVSTSTVSRIKRELGINSEKKI